jgi:hypothetical protein
VHRVGLLYEYKRELLNVLQHGMLFVVRVKERAVPRHQMDIRGQLEAPAALPTGNPPLVTTGGRLGEPQNRSGRLGEE